MEYTHFAILLLLIGFAFLIAEVFIPSGGLIFMGAVLCLGGSVWCAYFAWFAETPGRFWAYTTFVIVMVPTIIVGGIMILPKTRIGKRILLEAPHPEEVTGYRELSERLNRLVGRTGRTLTLHAPGGLVQVDGERLHSESEGELIEPRTAIEVVSIVGTRVLVRQIDEDELADRPASASNQDTTVDDEQLADANGDSAGSSHEQRDSQLDFDIPQS